MPYNPSGFFQRLFSWRNDRDAGIKIRADRMDQELDGLVDGLNQVISGEVDFKGPITGVFGTVGEPGYSFSGDPDTGIYRKSANNVGFSVGGQLAGEFKPDKTLDLKGRLTINNVDVLRRAFENIGGGISRTLINSGGNHDGIVYNEIQNKYIFFADASENDGSNLGASKVVATEFYAGLAGDQKVMHLSNGGAGSGFDADKLDGLEASQFLRSDKSNGSVQFGNNDELSYDDGTNQYLFTSDGLDLLKFDRQGGLTFKGNKIWHNQNLDLEGTSGQIVRKISARGGAALGADDAVIVGSGESVKTTLAEIDPNGESTYIVSDYGVNVITHLQTGWATRNEFTFGYNGDFWIGPYKAWHAGNVGAGSGFDADKLDGIHASSFVRNDQTNPEITAYKLRLTSGSDASASSTKHAFQIGADNTINVIIDNNEILARNNGVLVPLNANSGLRSAINPSDGYAIGNRNYNDARYAPRNIVQTHYAIAKAYAAAKNILLGDLNTTITPSSTNSQVLVTVNIAFECTHNGMFYLLRNNVEIGSAAAAGNRIVGMMPINFDNDFNSTMATTTITYLDSPNTTSAVTYKLGVRFLSSQEFSLNKTHSDSNAGDREHGASRMICEEK